MKKIRVWSPDTYQIVDAEVIEPCDAPHSANFWDFLVKLYVKDEINKSTYKLLMERFKIKEKKAKDTMEWFNNI